jgi:hypothetical protein
LLQNIGRDSSVSRGMVLFAIVADLLAILGVGAEVGKMCGEGTLE